jgi:hypothetical protein
MSQQCVDPIVGKILAGWRYDISGLAPEMRGDYESHFAGCEFCRRRQQRHRIIDVGLIALASISAGVFLLAFGVIRYFGPRHAFWLEIGALAGFALSALIWLVVAVATPAPVTMLDAAKEGARRVHDRLPEEIRQRLPEEIRLRITGT